MQLSISGSPKWDCNLSPIPVNVAGPTFLIQLPAWQRTGGRLQFCQMDAGRRRTVTACKTTICVPFGWTGVSGTAFAPLLNTVLLWLLNGHNSLK
jgi:hypothetical protein